MRLPRLIAIFVMLSALALVSCGSGSVPSEPDDTAPSEETISPLILPDAVLQPGQGLRFRPTPVGTPEPNPKLIVHIAPRDRNTRKPVAVPVTVLLGGRVIATGSSEYTLELPGVMPEPIELAVEGPGYERWAITLRYKLTNSRLWNVSVWLEPLSVVPATPGEL